MADLLTLAQAGPAAILLVGIVAIVRAFLTGAIVPGWVYKREPKPGIGPRLAKPCCSSQSRSLRRSPLMATANQAHPMGSSRWREWVEEKLPWYHPHTERLRNVKSEILSRISADTVDAAQRVIDRQQVIDAYEKADAAAHGTR